jgi:hypothetical protein
VPRIGEDEKAGGNVRSRSISGLPERGAHGERRRRDAEVSCAVSAVSD